MLELKTKQQEAVEAVNDPNIDTLVLLGTVGTGKTDIAAHIVISICHSFPKTYWPVFRANLTTSKKSVIPSYEEMLDKMGFIEGTDFAFNRTDYVITFPNKSKIVFTEADITKDRQARKIKGINATGNHIDEGDELSSTMLATATSRKGRRNQYGQPSISIHTINPTDHEYYVKIYNSFKFAGQEDESGMLIPPLKPNIKVIEFTIEDSWQTKSDIDSLMDNPKWWVERYIRNNWRYKDEEKTIFKSSIFAKARTDKITPGRKTMGYDYADEGRDRSGGAEWENFTLYDITIVKSADEKKTPEEQADWAIQRSDSRGIGYENIAIDGVGNGVGMITAGRMKGVDFAVYKSGFAPDKFLSFGDKALTRDEAEKNQELLSFNNLRSQVAYLLAMGLENGTVKLFIDTPHLKTFIEEAQQHHNDIKDKTFVLESKESIKKRTGKSPDIFDMVLMGFWKQLKKEVTTEWLTADQMM